MVGSETAARFEAAGWVTARPGEADSHFRLASVAQASRAVRRLLPATPPTVRLGTTATPAWLANDSRALAHPDDAVAVLEGPEEVGFVSVLDDEVVVAKGRVACDGDWAGITDVWVSPDHRRQGLALAVMAELLEWSAERGAGTAYLQVRGDNAPGHRALRRARASAPTTPTATWRGGADVRTRLVLVLLALVAGLTVAPSGGRGHVAPLRGHHLPQELREHLPLDADLGGVPGRRRTSGPPSSGSSGGPEPATSARRRTRAPRTTAGCPTGPTSPASPATTRAT